MVQSSKGLLAALCFWLFENNLKFLNSAIFRAHLMEKFFVKGKRINKKSPMLSA
jgi:hypothetical protein